ncbi:T9SS type A sorting domain-containing protein [Paraflavitalea soli]|nr:T9SS type A sorting domain-containing protein [Paraflavitalea soli]
MLMLSVTGITQTETHDFITYDTLWQSGTTKIMMTISRPTHMFTAGHVDTASRPVFITRPGAGENNGNNDTMKMNNRKFGPHYWMNNGWDGGIQLGNGKHYPIIITWSTNAANIRPNIVYAWLTYVLNTYHIKRNAVHVAGFSEGAFTWGRYICYKNPVTPEGPMSTITSAVFLQGQSDACCMSGFPAADNWGYGGYGTWAQKYNGKFFGLEGTTDGRSVWKPRDTIANRGFGANAYFSFEKLGGGEHCCWNQMYNPNAKDWRCVTPITNTAVIGTNGLHPNSMGTYIGGSIFEWMLRQGDTSMVGIEPPPNQPPMANAGNDRNIYLPQDSLHVSGSGTDTDGSIISYTWTQSSGPSATIASPSTPATTVTGLSVGTYIFRLTVTDDDGATGYDSLIVVVADTSTGVVLKKVNVNVYGGTNPYNNAAWNNWNNNVNSTIINLLYEDSTASGYNVSQTLTNGGAAVLTPSADNTATYGGTMCPPEVLRYASYVTVGRFLTISGLDVNKIYNISLFASRKVANPTTNNTNFAINGDTINILTDNNLANDATFTGITPSVSGTIVVSVTRGVGGTYTYLNGFVIEEAGTALLRTAGKTTTQKKISDEAAPADHTLEVFPNPVPDLVNLVLTNKLKGTVTVTLTNPSGVIMRNSRLQKGSTQLTTQLNVSGLSKGVYLLKITMAGYTEVKQIVKL